MQLHYDLQPQNQHKPDFPAVGLIFIHVAGTLQAERVIETDQLLGIKAEVHPKK